MGTVAPNDEFSNCAHGDFYLHRAPSIDTEPLYSFQSSVINEKI